MGLSASNQGNAVHFRHHKRILIIVFLAELLLVFNVDYEQAYHLNLVMAVLYFVISFWFIFGERQWWLYQFAGVSYVGYIIVYRIILLFELPMERSHYHLCLAGLWGIILLAHVFVERNFGPPVARPCKDRNKRYFPDDEDE